MRFLILAASSPTPSADPANTYYSPGTLGFIATFFMASISVLLIFDLVRRVRRVRYRAEIQEKLDAETASRGRKRNK